MINNIFDYCLIMAGGSGTRLWPASSTIKPKQFLPVAMSKKDTFFSLSLKRAFQVTKKESGKVIVITGKSHLHYVITACSELSPAEKKQIVLIPEPEAKNTAPVIACAITYSGKIGNKDNNMLILTSDHIIRPLEKFQDDAILAKKLSTQDKLVVFGISPTRPETGFGYIKTARIIDDNIYDTVAFLEKPDLKTAKKFTMSKKYFWNSGMFAFNCKFMKEEFHRLADDVIMPFELLKIPGEREYSRIKGLRILDNWKGLDKAYKNTKNISFDHAIAENIERTVMVEASFDWIDVGSWDVYAELLTEKRETGYGVTSTDVFTNGKCTDCFIDSDIPVALIEVEDLIIIIRSGKNGSPPAALIAKKGKTQQVKNIVEQIKKQGRTEIL